MGYMSAAAKVLNMSKRIGCEKCGKSNVTLYNIQNHYYCKDCK